MMFQKLEEFELSNAIVNDACVVNYLGKIANSVSKFELKNCQLNFTPRGAGLLFEALATN